MLPTNHLFAEILGGTYINIKNIIFFQKFYIYFMKLKKYINC